jgi:hypothetical protein
LLASFGHERLLETVERFEPGIDIDLGRLEQNTQAKATDSDLVAWKPELSR